MGVWVNCFGGWGDCLGVMEGTFWVVVGNCFRGWGETVLGLGKTVWEVGGELFYREGGFF